MKQDSAANKAIELLLADADDYHISIMRRSAARHELMDCAKLNGSLWDSIIPILVTAAHRSDFSNSISDHFVDQAPDWAFKKMYKQKPPIMTNGYDRRARLMKLIKSR